MHPRILSNKTKLDNLYTKVSSYTVPNEQVEWAKYLCVLTAGYIEESLRVLLLDFASKNSSIEIQRFVEREINFITNCKTERIVAVLNKFDINWAEKFANDIKDKSPIDREIKDSIDSIVSNRHLIAHGKSVGLTYATMNSYYTYCARAIEILEDTIK
tara:strand:+ start:3176 stop:3649 length:474 start_codon:yes stop_codon:yes gene_type:complete